MSILPVLIGLSIDRKKYYHLSWIPSEYGPLIIDYGVSKKVDNKIPFDYFVDRVKRNNITSTFTISLSNDYIKYNFIKKYKETSINSWNKSHYYNDRFLDSYDSYIYDTKSGSFNIHILKSKKNNIINQIKSTKYSLKNISVGIFSTLSGIKSWYDVKNVNSYMVLKLSSKQNIELLLIENNIVLGYLIARKKSDKFDVVNFYGGTKEENKLLDSIKSIFSGDIDSMDCHKLFYYSCDANKEDINYIASFQSEKFILINPFKNLKFDDNCSGKINPINSSAYSELGNAFGGIDV